MFKKRDKNKKHVYMLNKKTLNFMFTPWSHTLSNFDSRHETKKIIRSVCRHKVNKLCTLRYFLGRCALQASKKATFSLLL